MTTVKSNCGCCKTCKECPNCYDLGVEKVRQYLYAIDNKIVEYNETYLCIADWGYSCKPVTYEQFEKLSIFRSYLSHYYDSLRFGFNSGMCPDEIQAILEQVSKLISLNFHPSESFSNVRVDASNFNSWILENPYCLAYEDWEKNLVEACFSVGIQVRKLKKKQELLVNIKKVQDPCRFMYTVSVYNVACNIRSQVKVNKKECKVDYDVFVKEQKCDMSFDTYVRLLECNMTPKIMASLMSCGLDIDYNVKAKCPELIVNQKTKLLLCDLDINVFTSNVSQEVLAQYTGNTFTDFQVDELVESYVNDCENIKSEINGI